ncbi:SMI1/KNR4 family protein [Pannonibacter phragmitetus]|uniref:SMI1/KNR4 family protein n=1 Tax=Pannonibacter phragmitetus TaxID=121719 RepID=UPI000B968B63|nr:SMI1/KNR4 family protein [Pannonibacter phragmitetus]
MEVLVTLQEVIDLINQADDPSGRKRPLPDDALIEAYEEALGRKFPDDYKVFLKTVSNAFVGFMSPFTLSAGMPGGYGDLIAGVHDARSVGVPEDWLPVCEDNGDYYCITPEGSVRFWGHDGASDEVWPDLASWAHNVWLAGE